MIDKYSWLLVLVILFNYNKLKSQGLDSIKYIAKYSFEYKYDTTNKNLALKETMALALANGSSIFFSYDNMLKDSLLEAQYKLAILNGGKTGIDLSGSKETIPNIYYKDLNNNKLHAVKKIFNQFIMLDTLPKLEWKINNQSVVFNNLTCYTANCTYKGRDYTAIYAPEIPIFDGPWKFSGLPGLIVKIFDSKNEIIYELVEFAARNKFNNTYTTSSKTTEALKITKTEFNRLIKLLEDDPVGFVKTYASSYSISIPNGFRPQKSKINNPIELTD